MTRSIRVTNRDEKYLVEVLFAGAVVYATDPETAVHRFYEEVLPSREGCAEYEDHIPLTATAALDEPMPTEDFPDAGEYWVEFPASL